MATEEELQGLYRDAASVRWQILKGVLGWARTGKLCAGGCPEQLPGQTSSCTSFTPGGWLALADLGTCARYRSTWNIRTPIA